MQKIINYLSVITFIGLLVVVGLSFTSHPIVKFGAVPSTATTFNDINLDSTNGIGTGSLSQNGNPTITVGTNGADIAADVITATTSITAVSFSTTNATDTTLFATTLSATNSTLTNATATTLFATTFKAAGGTFTSLVKISQTASSTLKIGNAASGLGTGCLVLGDSGGTTSTPVYITATGATITASTTKPAICQ